MCASHSFSPLLGALDLGGTTVLLVVVATLILPFVVGRLLASALRMPDYGWRIGAIILATVGSILIVARYDLARGVDLKGGVILVYEVDEQAAALDAMPKAPDAPPDERGFNMGALIEALKRRINPSGTREIVIRPFGEQQVEIVIPDVGEAEVEQIKKRLSTAGQLQFRIVANRRDHQDIIDLAEQMATDPLKKRSRVVEDEEGKVVGMWYFVARDEQEVRGVRPFKTPVLGDILRDAGSGEFLEIPPEARFDDNYRLEDLLKERGIDEIQVLVAMNDGYDVTGANLGTVSASFDEQLVPCVNFNMRGVGAALFGGLTSSNTPDNDFYRRLGIVLDNELLSAPRLISTISDRGRITGNFTQQEVDFLVNILRAGSLPAALNKTPISENQISALLGEDTIRKGTTATWVSLVAVILFMLIYYRMSGLIACFALLLNLLMVVAVMVLIKAPLTLPGLAGLVLTVGMSVDANVLIYERMREEMAKESALRMTIRNGFARAMATIIDANLTTVLSAVILYVIGTDQLRGFAVTLILGLVISMFTAIFCSRVLFDIAERRRWLTEIRMLHLIGETHINFMAGAKYAITVSLVIMALGLVASVQLGKQILDTDLSGGTTVHMILEERMPTEEVRSRLTEAFRGLEKAQFTVTGINAGATGITNMFKVDSSLEDVPQLEKLIADTFRKPDGATLLDTYDLNYTPPKLTRVSVPVAKPVETSSPEEKSSPPADPVAPPDSSPPAASDDAAKKEAGSKEEGTEATPTPDAAPDSSPPAASDDAAKKEAGFKEGGTEATPTPDGNCGQPSASEEAEEPKAEEPKAEEPKVEEPKVEEPKVEEPKVEEPKVEEPKAEEPKETATTNGARQTAELTESELTFSNRIDAETLREQIEKIAADLNIPISDYELDNPEWDQHSSVPYARWTLRTSLPVDQMEQVLQRLEDEITNTPIWPSSSKIGGQVAGDTQQRALAAMFLSCVVIVAYVWFRFQHLVYGVAAVVALVHDVLVTVAAIAMSHWVAGYLDFLLIDPFKISLSVVAALLTIIGYSINDTIVIFDRIREVKGKSPELTGDMINLSVNQTLGRTILTAVTVFIVVFILYFMGGEGIHAFAFSLLIGVVAGSYSTVFIASPLVLWIAGRGKKASSPGKPAAA